MGWFVPQVMGVGYAYVGDALNGGLALKLMLLLLVLKLVATAVSYSSGNAGGIFGPSLFLGAMLGGAVGSVAHLYFPAHVAAPGAYALVGMGTAFAGIVRAPMTSVVMIFEITRDYTVIVPLMISNLVSYFIASKFQKMPIYEALAEQDGIHLPRGGSHIREGQRQVAQVMRPATEVLRADDPLQEALERAQKGAQEAWPVIEKQGVIGLITRKQMRAALDGSDPAKRVGDLVERGQFPHVHADHPLDLALERMGAARVDVLPVVNRANVHDLLGVVRLRDVLVSYGLNDPRES
jgi:CIC family chloride channel protein